MQPVVAALLRVDLIVRRGRRVCAHLHAEDSPTRSQSHSLCVVPNADACIRGLLSPNMLAPFTKPPTTPRFNGSRCPVRYKVSFGIFRAKILLNEIVMSQERKKLRPPLVYRKRISHTVVSVYVRMRISRARVCAHLIER